MRRKNPDESLRQLEQEYLRTRDPEILRRLNAARVRSGLPEAYTPPFTLEFGYTAGLPHNITAAWGARAILADTGYVDIPPDRRSVQGPQEEVSALLRAMNSPGLWNVALEEINRLVKAGKLLPDERKEHILAMDRNLGVVIVGNTNASHGYLYLAAFFMPPDYQFAPAMCEVCDQVLAVQSNICTSCHGRFCYPRCTGPICYTCDYVRCKKCATRGICEQCENIICTSQTCEQDRPAYYCVHCGKLLCFDCSDGPLPQRVIRMGTAPVCEECHENPPGDDDEDEDFIDHEDEGDDEDD